MQSNFARQNLSVLIQNRKIGVKIELGLLTVGNVVGLSSAGSLLSPMRMRNMFQKKRITCLPPTAWMH